MPKSEEIVTFVKKYHVMIASKPFNYLYIVICLFSLIAMNIYHPGYMVLKPLIVSSLLAYYITSVKTQHSYIILGLVFAIIGDVLLLFDTSMFFVFGLIAFLFQQILYILYLRQFEEKNLSKTQKILLTVLPILYVTFSVFAVVSKIPDLIFILFYAFMLLYMAYTAIKFPRLGKEISIIGIGAILFVLSDLMLAINKFIYPNVWLNTSVMVFYMLAQYMIIIGITADAKEYFNRLNQFKAKQKQ